MLLRYGFDQVNYSGGQPSSIKPPQDKKDPKYACDQCSYIATQKSSLTRHKQTQHEGIRQPTYHSGKTYDCDVCPYQATQLSSLKRHKLAKHSGAQFNCDQCEYIGTTQINLKLHKRSKHEMIRYPCDVCGYEATQPGVLNRHKEQKHGVLRNIEHRTHNNYNTTTASQKPHRDPNAPRRPLSGFFHFSNVGRAKIKAANPDFTVADISKELSRRWHALDEVTRSMFEQMADNDKQRFRQEKAEYNMSPKGGYKQTRAKKDPNAPKRPLCGFMMFSNEERVKVREIMPNAGVGELGKELGKRWAEASPEVRDKYNEMAAQDKSRFAREKQEYVMQPHQGRWRGARAKKDPNAPKRNVPAFMWFSNEERGKVRALSPGMRVGDCAKELSRRWALADPETKARFEQMAFEDKQRYEREKHEFHMAQRQKELNRPRAIEGSASEATFQITSSSSASSSTQPTNSNQPSNPSWNPNNPTNNQSNNQGNNQNNQPSNNPATNLTINPVTNPGTSTTNPLPIVQQNNTSPPLSQVQVHAPSPPIHIINHHPTPTPTIRYGY